MSKRFLERPNKVKKFKDFEGKTIRKIEVTYSDVGLGGYSWFDVTFSDGSFCKISCLDIYDETGNLFHEAD